MAKEGLTYRRLAKYYDLIYKNIVGYEAQSDMILKMMKGRIRNILDLACGTGNYSYIFAKRGYNVTGVDISSEMIKVAREKSVTRHHPEFLKMDVSKLDLPGREKTFDAALLLFGGFGYLLG